MSDLSLPEFDDDLRKLVSRYEIRSLLETGTGPTSSGMEIAKRLGLHGYSCDVSLPCVERARDLYPDFQIVHADSLTFLRDVLPSIEGPTLFWLDGHCPTTAGCLPGSVFPLYDEMLLIRDLKGDLYRDVLWLDDVQLIRDPLSPVHASETEWSVVLNGNETAWTGERDHALADYLAVFEKTHDAEVVERILRFTPKGV
jgi:hypothetical protein